MHVVIHDLLAESLVRVSLRSMSSKEGNPNITVRVTPLLKEHWLAYCCLLELESSVFLRAVVRAALIQDPTNDSDGSVYDTGDRQEYINTRLGRELWIQLDEKFQAKKQKAVFIRGAMIAALSRFREEFSLDETELNRLNVRIDWPYRF